jgi:signal transduction histidine kinase
MFLDLHDHLGNLLSNTMADLQQKREGSNNERGKEAGD